MEGRVPFILKQHPDMTPDEMDYLETFIKAGSRVWEWGTGGSTLWFIRKGCRVTSVEHMDLCYQVLSLGLSRVQLTGLFEMKYCPADRGYREGTTDDGTREHFAGYVDSYDGRFQDLFLVDGRARLACLERLKLAPPTATILLHDADRYDYSAIAEKVGGVEQLHQLRLKR